MILLVLAILAGFGYAQSRMGECDGRTVGLHRECVSLQGPLVPGQDLTPPRLQRFGVDLNDPRVWASPDMARCAANAHLCE